MISVKGEPLSELGALMITTLHHGVFEEVVLALPNLCAHGGRWMAPL